MKKLLQTTYSYMYCYGGFRHSIITNDMITGKYLFRYNKMNIQLKEKNSFFDRYILLKGKYRYFYVHEDNIHFTETLYFDCKENDL